MGNLAYDLAYDNSANCNAIVEAGGIAALVALVDNGDARAKVAAAKALASLARDDVICAAIADAGGIPPLVALLANGAADGQEQAARALGNLAYNNANKVAIADAGGIQAFVALVTNGAAGAQEHAAAALRNLAYDNAANTVAIADAGGIGPLVALVTKGTADGQKWAADALLNLTYNNTANKVAIVCAGAIKPLVALETKGAPGSRRSAAHALQILDLADADYISYITRLKSENPSLKRQLPEDDVVDLRDDNSQPPKKKRNLRDEVDEQKQAVLKRVKQEKVAVEGARDRAVEDLEDVQDDVVNPLTLTVNALQTKIDELHALARQVDPAAADAIKYRPN